MQDGSSAAGRAFPQAERIRTRSGGCVLPAAEKPKARRSVPLAEREVRQLALVCWTMMVCDGIGAGKPPLPSASLMVRLVSK